ncbi:MAG: M1 family metallopeptidase [Flavobacteriales bacterium]|nr:M1 family metallopeptidase [Flavobacteriales bacterium]MCB9198405.1 M1 family metallopeptidase [Flavobacteriales bacterium]
MKRIVLSLVAMTTMLSCTAQKGYWQQRVEYTMEIDMDVETNRFSGKQKLVYENNSPDTLDRVFYHLYYNAFQPGSMMDVRSRTIEDPDPRVEDRIAKLSKDEIGFHEIKYLKKNGVAQKYEMVGTILEVELDQPILPGKKVTFEMEFESQVPLQIRRTGRDNVEGIEYSMTQWYPKMCEYDKEGWHANPYIGREFHGVWGDFDVKISIDKNYVLGGTGYIQNPQEVGCGYEDPSKKMVSVTGNKKTWHFKAPNVHDFAWAADPDFVHDTTMLNNGTIIHFLFQNDTLGENWRNLKSFAKKGFEYVNANFGEYPYKQYSVIQGGDGGMEYPMCTLITSEGSFAGLVSVTIHEGIHSWFQGILATNEAKYAWMDEGYCTFAQYKTLDYLYEKNTLNPLSRNYMGYIRLAQTDKEEPLTTHADFYKLNGVYGSNAYSKGAVLLMQLGYVIGEEALMRTMKRYFNEWKFKHPTPLDFKRIAEKESGLELDWYFEQFVETTNTIDYAVKSVEAVGNKSEITLERIGDMPMPIDVIVYKKDGDLIWYNIPMRIMRGEKGEDIIKVKRETLVDWPWVYPQYTFTIDIPVSQIAEVVIDPTNRLADIEPTNNTLVPNGSPASEEIVPFKGN